MKADKHKKRFYYKLILCSLLICFVCISCRQNKLESLPTRSTSVSNLVETTDMDSNSVYLYDIKQPKYGKKFCTFYSGYKEYRINWGINGRYIDDRSNFPGFDYPLLICGNGMLCKDSVVLKTSYGSYIYELIDSTAAFKDEAMIRNSDTGQELISFDKKEEILYVFSGDTLYTYKLNNGTKIIL